MIDLTKALMREYSDSKTISSFTASKMLQQAIRLYGNFIMNCLLYKTGKQGRMVNLFPVVFQ